MSVGLHTVREGFECTDFHICCSITTKVVTATVDYSESILDGADINYNTVHGESISEGEWLDCNSCDKKNCTNMK